jgi:hypothetical protein
MDSTPRRVHVPSVIVLLISGLGLISALAAAVGLFANGLIGLISGSGTVPEIPEQTRSLFSLAWISGLVALLLIPVLASALITVLNVSRRSLQWIERLGAVRIASVLMIAWPFVIALGAWIARSDFYTWLFLPPIQIYVIAVPLWWLLELGRRGLPGGRPQRSWNLMGISLVVTPTLILVIESAVLVAIALLAALITALQPGAIEMLTALGQRIAGSGGRQSQILRLMQPILRNPAVIYGILATMSGAVPLVEETLKPLAVWGLIKRPLEPAEGFKAGLICGACFGLMESLGAVTTVSGDAWMFTVIARFGTGLLHTVTAGLMGYGLASAWSRKQYVQLGGIFLLCVGLHGTWNCFSLLMGLVSAMGLDSAAQGFLGLAQRLSGIAPAVLIILVVVLFLILIGANRILRRDAARETTLPSSVPDASLELQAVSTGSAPANSD